MDLNTATASQIVAAAARGSITAEAVAAHFLTRISEHEPAIQAFASFDADAVRAQASNADASEVKGPLHGLCLGVKDIYDTADHPTRYFSPIYAHHRPSRDAAVVALLRAAGAIVMGKTATTEFAYMHTGPTRNPHDPGRTPGSSSAGSGAGMAAGFFTAALGTQTAGSLLKPGSFCGAFAYKPTFGLVSMEGIKPLAPSFDTAGWYGRGVDDLILLARVLIPALVPESPRERLRLAVVRAPHTERTNPDVVEALGRACQRLREAGHGVDELAMPEGFEVSYADHAFINDVEGTRSLLVERRGAPEMLSPEITAMMARADAVSWQEEQRVRTRFSGLRDAVEPLVVGYDAVLDLATQNPAPLGLAGTGPSDAIKAWSGFGFPQVGLPALASAEGLPVGLQLFAARYRDARLLMAAERVAADLPDAAFQAAAMPNPRRPPGSNG
jgi:Asp-tRNA(Asn)/Glu-tRNA(Gln) amidotransferase A subunit family amidase